MTYLGKLYLCSRLTKTGRKKLFLSHLTGRIWLGSPRFWSGWNWPFFTPICQKAWQANYFIRARRLKIHIKCSEFGFVARDESNGISWFAKFSNKSQFLFCFGESNYFIRKFWHGWSYFLHSPRLSFLIPLYSIIYRGIIVSNSRSLNWPSFNVIIKDDWP